jgi:[ribosomal protein S18]-alanine N-acetyltransferase
MIDRLTAAIAQLEIESFERPWSRDQIKEFIANSAAHPILINGEGRAAEPDDLPVGYALLLVLPAEQATELLRIGVALNRRRQGLGLSIMQHLIAFTLSRFGENGKCFLEVNEKNLPAIKLYESVGFTVRSIRRNYYADSEHALLMQWPGIDRTK